jgi:hypothetical protein
MNEYNLLDTGIQLATKYKEYLDGALSFFTIPKVEIASSKMTIRGKLARLCYLIHDEHNNKVNESMFKILLGSVELPIDHPEIKYYIQEIKYTILIPVKD